MSHEQAYITLSPKLDCSFAWIMVTSTPNCIVGAKARGDTVIHAMSLERVTV